ncbi:hypothetical protein V4Y02_23470, partial [Escherichia coli]
EVSESTPTLLNLLLPQHAIHEDGHIIVKMSHFYFKRKEIKHNKHMESQICNLVLIPWTLPKLSPE